MLVSPVQLRNASTPIVVTLLGIVMLVSPVQFWNAESPIVFPPVIITVLSDAGVLLLCCHINAPNSHPKWVFVVPFKVLPTNGIVMLVSPVQPWNA